MNLITFKNNRIDLINQYKLPNTFYLSVNDIIYYDDSVKFITHNPNEIINELVCFKDGGYLLSGNITFLNNQNIDKLKFKIKLEKSSFDQLNSKLDFKIVSEGYIELTINKKMKFFNKLYKI